MTQSVVGGVTSSSVYFGDGVRKSHTVNGTTTTYKWDVLASLPVVIQDGTYSYAYGLDLISMTDGSGNQHYFSYDGLGSVSDLTNGAGTVTDTFAYDVFGTARTRTGTTATLWKFTGEQADDGTGDSGYYYLRARHYDPAVGRFVGRDKIAFPQRYAYANGNPALLVDPSGMCSLLGVQCGTTANRLTIAGAGVSLSAAICVVATLGGCAPFALAASWFAVGSSVSVLGLHGVMAYQGELPNAREELAVDALSLAAGGVGLRLAKYAGVAWYANTLPLDLVGSVQAAVNLHSPPTSQTQRRDRPASAAPAPQAPSKE